MQQQSENSRFQKFAWFVGLWVAGVGTLAVIGYGIRFWLGL